jgi:crotonobetainyl-CoA:carnitine CoA-transferase CaiB-like acyl-CoA transferase
MYAFSGILAALYERERTGEGSALEVSLFDALTEWMGFPLQYAAGAGRAPRRAGTSHAAIAPYGTFAVGDGGEVVLAVQNEREWGRFCADVLGEADLATDERFATGSARVQHRPALHAAIDAVFALLTSGEVARRLEAAGIAHARRRDLLGDDGVLAHPQHRARDRWTAVGSPAGPVRSLLPPISLAGRTPRMDPIPDIGEHTEAVLAEFGLGALRAREQ